MLNEALDYKMENPFISFEDCAQKFGVDKLSLRQLYLDVYGVGFLEEVKIDVLEQHLDIALESLRYTEKSFSQALKDYCKKEKISYSRYRVKEVREIVRRDIAKDIMSLDISSLEEAKIPHGFVGKTHDKFARNILIARLMEMGYGPTELGKKFKVSRQRVFTLHKEYLRYIKS